MHHMKKCERADARVVQEKEGRKRGGHVTWIGKSVAIPLFLK